MWDVKLCLQCQRSTDLIESGTRVNAGVIFDESVCLACGLLFTETIVGRESKRGRVSFQAPHPKQKHQIAELKMLDRSMYVGWVEILGTIQENIDLQLQSGQFSNYACHFLATARVVVGYLKIILRRRIDSVDLYFRGQEDTGNQVSTDF